MISWVRKTAAYWIDRTRRWADMAIFETLRSTRQSIAALRWQLRVPLWVRLLPAHFRYFRAWGTWMARRIAFAPIVALQTPLRRRLVLGTPVFAACIVVPTLAALYFSTDPSKLVESYQKKAAAALAAKQWDRAELLYRRLLSDHTQSAEAAFGLAQSLEGLARHDQANEILDLVAAPDATGYWQAQIRRARQLLAKDSLKREDTNAIEALLNRAIVSGPNPLEAHAILAELYVRIGFVGAAREHLLIAVTEFPELGLPLARFADADRDSAAAMRWAKLAAGAYRSKLDAMPADPAIRLNLMESLQRSREFQAAAEVLRADRSIIQTESARELAVQLFAGWYDSLASNPGGSEERLRILEEGLNVAPNAGLLLQRLVETSFASDGAGEKARADLQRRLLDQKAAALIHLSSGMEAYKRGNLAEAQSRFQRCLEIDPDSSIAANNLAWMLATGPRPEPQKAIELISNALKRNPDNPSLRDTRGLVLVRLGRWNEAVQDLEFALGRIPPNRQSHLALAHAYRELKLPRLAEDHEKRASQLR